MLSLSLFLTSTEIFWETDDSTVFSLYVVYQIVYNVLGTP